MSLLGLLLLFQLEWLSQKVHGQQMLARMCVESQAEFLPLLLALLRVGAEKAVDGAGGQEGGHLQ